MKTGGSVSSEYCGGGRMRKKEGGKIDAADIKQDKKIVKKAIGMHDDQQHEAKTDLSKLKKGGRTKKKEGTVKKFSDGKSTGPLDTIVGLAKRAYNRGKRNLLGTDAQNDAAAAAQAARDAAAANVPAQTGTAPTDQEGQAFQDSLANVPAKKRGGKVKGKC